MNCFVIMPFAQEFDDVYVAIKTGVTNAASSGSSRCFRLDEAQPAGRITDRLLKELRSASLCIADITGHRPNVMWELGFAMALGHPTIILSQTQKDLPFDIKDMQAIQYDRSRLNSTLSVPLQKIVIDTVSSRDQVSASDSQNDLVGQLLSEMADLKNIVRQSVRSWDESALHPGTTSQDNASLANLGGSWVSRASGSHLYASMVGSDLIVPYCYGYNDGLTGAYFGWRRVGEYWFARFAWSDEGNPAGFAFLQQTSVDVLRGAWWGESEGLGLPSAPPDKNGVASTWERAKDAKVPDWAAGFLKDVKEHGLSRTLGRSLSI